MNSINSIFSSTKSNYVNFKSKSEKQNVNSYPIKDYSSDEYVTSEGSSKQYTSNLAKLFYTFNMKNTADSIQNKRDRKKEAVERAKRINQLKKEKAEFNEKVRNVKWIEEMFDDFFHANDIPKQAAQDCVAKMEKEHGKLKYNIRCKNKNQLPCGHYNLLIFEDDSVHRTPFYDGINLDRRVSDRMDIYISFENEKKSITKKEYDKLFDALKYAHGFIKVNGENEYYSKERNGIVKVLDFSDRTRVEMPPVKD